MIPVPLHVRSRHSLGFGTATVEELAARAASLQIPALALTDIETLAGQLRFHHACTEHGIRPITGLELRAGHGRHALGMLPGRLVLLARDSGGYASLCRIVSRRRNASPTSLTADPITSLQGDERGLYVLSDDPAALRRLLALDVVERESLGLLLARPRAATPQRGSGAAGADLRKAASQLGVPLVPDLEVAGLDDGDRELHTLLLAIRQRLTVAEVRRGRLAGDSGILDARALESFADLPQAIRAGRAIADACQLDLRELPRVPPRLPELDGIGAVRELRHRCADALADSRARGDLRGTEYDDRLASELATIERLGFVDYFLAVAEIVRGARDLAVTTAGRGSAAGSLVAHLLGITPIDPVATDLLFERFLHERRDAPPDIDLDVASKGRDALLAWVARRFGRDRVAGVASYQTFRTRSAVRTGLSALGVAPARIARVLDRIDPGEASGVEEAELLERALSVERSPEVRSHAASIRRLVGMPAHLAAHPGGTVIGDGPLDSLLPLERAPGGAVVTQYDHLSVERAGLLKIDLLGNHFLSEMQEALADLRAEGEPQARDVLELLRRRHGTSPAGPADAATWRTLDEADTIGCFQVESPAVRSVLRRLPVGEFDDLVAALAVVRPGAAAGAAKERYLRRARGEERFEALAILGIRDGRVAGTERVTSGNGCEVREESLRRRLQRTRGVLLYDEDIIRLLATIGGMATAEADALRTAIVTAGEDREALGWLGEEFVSRALAAGWSRSTASRAWQAAARFASYSFAEAHAASYAVLAWQAAWLRTHAPVEFGRALIDHHRALYPLRTIAAAVQRWGADLRPPSVNRSQLASGLEREPGRPPAVRVGLGSIKGLSKRAAVDIIGGAPYGDVGQLMERARPSKREIRALLLSGACDELAPLSDSGYPMVHEVVLEGLAGNVAPAALNDVLERVATLPVSGPEAAKVQAYRELVRVRNEIDFLGMHISNHPMRLLREDAKQLGCLPAAELWKRPGRLVRFAGLFTASRRVPVRGGELRFLTLEDETGLIEAVLPPEAHERLRERLTTPGPYLIDGFTRAEAGDVNLVVENLSAFHERE